MPFPDAIAQFEYWDRFPPTHELVAVLARCFTTWQPAARLPAPAPAPRAEPAAGAARPDAGLLVREARSSGMTVQPGTLRDWLKPKAP